MTIENSGYVLQGEVTKEDNKAYEVAILFDYIQDETSTVEADITDNWVESNYSIQDHIAIKPRMYRLRGCVGEVIYEDVSKLLEMFEQAKINHPVLDKTVNLLNGVSGLSGVVSNYTNLAINLAKQIESSYDRYKKMWQNFTNRNTFSNKRQVAVYAMLQEMLRNRKPVKLTNLMYAPEPLTENQYEKLYYLQSVSAHQGDNAYISDIEVTIKEFRIAVTKTTKVDKNKFAGITATQKTAEANNGLSKGETVKPADATNAINKAGNNIKKAINETLNPKPAYKAVKTFYNALETVFNQGAKLGNTLREQK